RIRLVRVARGGRGGGPGDARGLRGRRLRGAGLGLAGGGARGGHASRSRGGGCVRFASTRGGAPPTPVDEALAAGLAPDGGLYVPESIPCLAWPAPLPSLAETAAFVLAPFFADSSLRARLGGICAR